MPELPEVETTRRGVAPHVEGQDVNRIIVRNHRLRWPIPDDLATHLDGHCINSVGRRGKYLLFNTDDGSLLVHLGMSGSLRVLPDDTIVEKHDHVDIVLSNHQCLRFRDPRRFGAVLWQEGDAEQHPLLAELGPEPLSEAFTSDHLHKACRGRSVAIKNLLMNSKVVVGVGNIYANEALFRSGIHPNSPAGHLKPRHCQKLTEEVKSVLAAAIEQGGTTLRDFLQSDGKPGYFQQTLQVYGREGESCFTCQRPVEQMRIGQRSTFFCKHCQKLL